MRYELERLHSSKVWSSIVTSSPDTKQYQPSCSASQQDSSPLRAMRPKKRNSGFWYVFHKFSSLFQPKRLGVLNQINSRKQSTGKERSTSQSSTVSLSLAPQLLTEHRLEVSFKPIVSTSKSRRYLHRYIIYIMGWSFDYERENSRYNNKCIISA